MSYLKLPKTVQDHGLGFQTVNQASSNNENIFDVLDSRHSVGVAGDSPYRVPLRAVGRHDDILIARSAEYFQVQGNTVVSLKPIFFAPVFAPFQYQRLATGQWTIFLATPQLFAAVAMPDASTSVTHRASCVIAYNANGPNVTVSTRVLATDTLTDMNFSLVVWTQRAQ